MVGYQNNQIVSKEICFYVFVSNSGCDAWLAVGEHTDSEKYMITDHWSGNNVWPLASSPYWYWWWWWLQALILMMMMIAVPNQRAGNQIRQERHSAARWAINISSFAFRVSLLSRHVMLIKWWFWLRNQSFSRLQTGDSQERLVLIPDSPRKTGKEKRCEKTTFWYMGDQFHCSCIKQHNCFRFAEIAMQSKLTRDCFQWKYFELLPIMVTNPKLGNADISTCTTLWRKGFWVIWAMPERKRFFLCDVFP